MTNPLAQLEALIAGLDPAKKADLDRLIGPELNLAWLPNPGPQTQAYHSNAGLLLYGGAAGGGKTDLLCGLPLTKHERSVIFRRQSIDLDGYWERLLEICPSPASKDGVKKKLKSKDNRLIECGHLEAPGAELSWQGRPHDFIGFDEGAQLTRQKVSFVLGWLRSATPGQRCRAVIASNPPLGGEGDWLIEWFAPWLDPMFPKPAKPGELRWAYEYGRGDQVRTVWVDGPDPVTIDGETYTPLSRTFIPAFLDDNPYLKDTDYRARIQSMPEPLRSKLLKGDFMTGRQDHEWQIIPTEWVELAQRRWEKGKPQGIGMTTVGVDPSGGYSDRFVVAPLWGNWFAEPSIYSDVDCRDGAKAGSLVLKDMRNNALPVIDLTGGWGGGIVTHLKGLSITSQEVIFSHGTTQRAKCGKWGFYNLRAELWWTLREALDPESGENIALPPGQNVRAELTAPRWRPKGDKILVESKDEIRARLNSSPDIADAIVMAWRYRALSLAKKAQKNAVHHYAVEADDPLGEWG